MYRQRIWVLFSVAALGLLFTHGICSAAEKGDYPQKTIRMISSWPGGGGGDQETRGISLYLKKYLPVQIVVENVPGAAAKIGVTKAWKSEPDGYTLVYITPPQPILNEYMSKTEYKTKEFAFIYGFFKRALALTVNVDTWKTVEDFVNAAKKKTFSIGLSSLGSAAHLNAVESARTWGINANWVPFETGTDAVVQVAGRHLDAAVTMATTALPLVRGGKVRALLIYSENRIEGFEDVPTPGERGYSIPFIYGLGGIVAPPKTPAHVVKVLEEACDKSSRDPEFLAWAAKSKYEVSRLSSEEFKKKILEQYKIVEENIALIKSSEGK